MAWSYTQSQIRIAAAQLATDADLCRMFAITQQQLERHRPLIEAARAKSMVQLKYKRATAQATRVKKADPYASE